MTDQGEVEGTLHISGDDAGHVVIFLGNKASTCQVSLPAREAANVAAAILEIAAKSDPKGAKHAPVGSVEWIPIKPTTVTLGSSPVPGSEALVFGFGPALLGLSLSKPRLKQLGEAMIALSASGKAQ